ncbi:MAG: hypothetical protein OXH70_02070 [Acidobacteria bacterium]|nr:hypothetical protein [Acidobacteriota bacterium]MCY3971584.1 hypothetical protein [Acidobacteriota bacterium]
MGNRAVVLFANRTSVSCATYLHWNGGPESVYPLLDELDRRGIDADTTFQPARFIQIAGEFFDQDRHSTYHLRVFNAPRIPEGWFVRALEPHHFGGLNHGDNGVYLVDRSGDRRCVRRFLSTGYASNDTRRLYELSPAQVETERQAAYRHPYNTGANTIAAYFSRERKPVA